MAENFFIWEKAKQVVGSLRDAIMGYGPEAIDLAMDVVRIMALSELFPGIVAFILLCLWIKSSFMSKMWQFGKDNIRTMDPAPVFVCILTIGVPITLVLITIVNLFNVWAWIGIFVPEIYAAKLFVIDKLL